MRLLGQLPAGLCAEDRDVLAGDEGFAAEEALLRVGLAVERSGRIDLLAPIREHARRHHLPEPPDDAAWRQAAKFIAEAEPPTFPIKGADLVALGVAPGRALGAALKRLQANWIRAGFPRDPRRVLQLLEDVAPNGED